MPRMNLKTSVVLLAISIFLAGLAKQVQACDGHSYDYRPRAGYIPGMLPPTGFQPGLGGLYGPSTTTITIERK